MRTFLLGALFLLSSLSLADNQRTDFLDWFETDTLIGSSSIGENRFANYAYLLPIAMNRLAENRTDGWELKQIKNYFWGESVAPVQKLVPINQKGERELLVTQGFYYLTKIIEGREARIIVEVWCEFGRPAYHGEIYALDSNVEDARDFLGTLSEYLTTKNIYKNAALEMIAGQVWFLTNVDDFHYDKDEIILAPELKRDVLDHSIGFISGFEQALSFGLGPKKGLLLAGPPGTGKSFLGQILISSILHGELQGKACFFVVTARHLQYPFDVQTLFSVAKDLAPAVLFLEDIDLLGIRDRTQDEDSVYASASEPVIGHLSKGIPALWLEEREAAKRSSLVSRELESNDLADEVLNELLNGIDGVSDSSGLLIVGTTNKHNSIDKALLRSGRLGLHFYFGLPKFNERQEFFDRFARRHVVWAADLSLAWLAGETEGLSGSDIIEAIAIAKQEAYLDGHREDGKLLLNQEYFKRAFTIVKPNSLDGKSLSLKKALELYKTTELKLMAP